MWYRLEATEKVTGMGFTHPLWLRANRDQPYTILIVATDSGETAVATMEPSITELKEAVRYYHGGHEYILSEEEAAPIFAAGFGDWLVGVEE